MYNCIGSIKSFGRKHFRAFLKCLNISSLACFFSGSLHFCRLVVLSTFKIQILYPLGFRSVNLLSSVILPFGCDWLIVWVLGCQCNSIFFSFYAKLSYIVLLFREGISMVHGSNISDWNTSTVLQKGRMLPIRYKFEWGM